MSISKKNIAIYSNLPPGGAEEVRRVSTKFLKTKAKVVEYSDKDIHPRNLFEYLYICLTKLPKIHMQLAKSILSKSDILIAHHSWLTKSPHMLRYVTIPIIYFCQEPLREYYDQEHMRSQSLKDKLVNLIRLPIKSIDQKNMSNKNIYVIANSKLSKKLIDKTYGVDSIVVYPGIDTDAYIPNKNIKKVNQVISIGAINHLKGHEFLIRSLSYVDKNVRPSLIIIGSGKDEKYFTELNKIAKSLEVTLKVRVNISRKRLIAELHKSKIFLFSPKNEPFGLVVAEAIASGLPIIVYEHGGGYIEKVNDKNGIIISELNPEKWGREISNLIQNHSALDQYRDYNIHYAKTCLDEKVMNESILKLINKL